MRWPPGYIAVDWGTTNRRAYAIDGSGRVTAKMADERGLRAIGRSGFDAAVAEIRCRLGDRPMLLAGMVGSREGWRDAGYIACPAASEDLARAILWVEQDRTGIIPGVCQQGSPGPDVMRGEEVQVIGALARGLPGSEATICHPGTHTKWIEVQGGRIASIRTMMTGELFNLIRQHSILAPQLVGTARPDDAFDRGVDEGLCERTILTGLFRIRARDLLGESAGEPASYASGLLIGNDVAAGLNGRRGEEVFVVGRPDLCELYGRALERAGHSARVVDGAEAFVAGIHALSEAI